MNIAGTIPCNYFVPLGATSSITVCANCGLEKFLHGVPQLEPMYNAEYKQPTSPLIEKEDDGFEKFLDKEIALKLSDRKTIDRVRWYYQTYFKTDQTPLQELEKWIESNPVNVLHTRTLLKKIKELKSKD